MLRTATRVEAMLVALESLIQSTPPRSPTGSSRCGGASNVRSPAAIASGSAPPAAPRARRSAFATLCGPRMRSSSAREQPLLGVRPRRSVSHPSSAR
jgi:hypothetical protein